MKIRPFLFFRLFIPGLMIITACSNQEPLSLAGAWNATKLQEEGKTLDVQLDKIRFSFDQNNIYHYESTLNYREAGHYILKSKYLYTTDTLNQASTEKVVELVKISDDTLVIKMNQAGKERLLTLAKE